MGIRLRFVLVVSLAALAGCQQNETTSGLAADSRRPNILLIVADDLGYQDLSVFGGESAHPRSTRSLPDPGETTDLGAAHPDVMSELAAAWERHAEEVGVAPPARPPGAPPVPPGG